MTYEALGGDATGAKIEAAMRADYMLAEQEFVGFGPWMFRTCYDAMTMSIEGALRKHQIEWRAGLDAARSSQGKSQIAWLPYFNQPRTLASLARIRGAMWTQYLNLPMGPRPGQDNNINAMDYYEFYSADDRKRMIDRTLEDGFTHAVTGPLFDADGYHGKYPTNTDLSQRYFDHYLDAMQEWSDAKITPVHFQKPDGWTLDQLRANMESLYVQDRAKALLPIKVPAGWEPWRYEASSRTWGTFFDWAAEVDDQKSLILAHSVADVDALVGTDAVYDDNGRPNNESWVYLAPKMHGWLIQLGGYVGLQGEPTVEQLDTWRRNLRTYFVDNRERFVNGKAGWPTGSKFGPGVPLKRYYGEGGSFKFFWGGNVPETLVQSFGDIAVDAGADGYLDGGTVGVP